MIMSEEPNGIIERSFPVRVGMGTPSLANPDWTTLKELPYRMPIWIVCGEVIHAMVCMEKEYWMGIN
jgi:hypothetical protein